MEILTTAPPSKTGCHQKGMEAGIAAQVDALGWGDAALLEPLCTELGCLRHPQRVI